MSQITASLVRELREKTNAGMMDCKAALVEAGGDLEEAAVILRKKGIAKADKKSARAAQEGVIRAAISDDGHVGALVEINCETDFVAKNESFDSFAAAVVEHAAAGGFDSLEQLLAAPFQGVDSLEDAVKAKIAEVGENIVVRRFSRFAMAADSQGLIASYIHLAGRVGVLVELGCEKAATAATDGFKELAKDLTLHVAASSPICVVREDIPSEKVEAEKEVYRGQVKEQMKGKPEDMIEKIIEGKLGKFYSTACLLEQGFVKEPDSSIADLLVKVGKTLGDTLVVRRFARFAVGEEA
jgi:elongation factor Ts